MATGAFFLGAIKRCIFRLALALRHFALSLFFVFESGDMDYDMHRGPPCEQQKKIITRCSGLLRKLRISKQFRIVERFIVAQFLIIDFRFDWENSKIIFCCMFIESRKHFYIHHTIECEQEADELIQQWELNTTMFFDTEYQHPN